MKSLLITVCRSSFLSVKSCSTCTAAPLNAMIAIRSAGVICVWMNFMRRRFRAHLVRHRHRAHVEVHRHQAPVAIAYVARTLRRDLVRRHSRNRNRGLPGVSVARRCRGRRCRRFGRLHHLVQLLEFAEADGLRHAVFGNREIFRRQPLYRLAVLVLHRHRLDHQLRVGLKLDGRRWRLRRAARGLAQPVAPRPAARKSVRSK